MITVTRTNREVANSIHAVAAALWRRAMGGDPREKFGTQTFDEILGHVDAIQRAADAIATLPEDDYVHH